MTIKKQIEKKQEQLQRFVNQGRLTQTEANRQVMQFASWLVGYWGMKMVLELYYWDLTEEAKQRFLEFQEIKSAEEGNYDVFPVAIIEQGEA